MSDVDREIAAAEKACREADETLAKSREARGKGFDFDDDTTDDEGGRRQTRRTRQRRLLVRR